MLGRVRRSSISSLELLEMERPPSKLIKDDPLSIYETTLMKLKEGSQRCQNLPLADATSTDVSCITTSDSPEIIDADCSSTNSSHIFSGDQPTPGSFSTARRDKNPSVLYLFSKYKNPKIASSSSLEEAMIFVCSSASTSPSVGNSQFMSNQRQHLPEECFDSEMI